MVSRGKNGSVFGALAPSRERDQAMLEDTENIEKTFTQSGMNYDVFKIRDKTSVDLMVELTGYAELANGNNHYQSFAIFVLSHGDKGQILAADGQPIAMSTIANTFSTEQHPNLDGKPRVVIFQACLGNKKPEFTTGTLKDDLLKACDEGNDEENVKQLKSTKEVESDHFTDPIQYIDPITDEHSIPSADGPDFVFGFATLPGCTAIRTPEGSPFIKLLMDEIRSDIKYGHPIRKSVIEMLQTVNDRMLQDHCICIQMSTNISDFERHPSIPK
ncbi:caspase-8-like [Lingula anatina]|uniref:Caspase-8-like n=1 Tax=Lingula anatina TaxID=7574 RepID=A0A2R2MIA0_LINAN|nr:caspase-8-like [Lingula anatina]|eukprot:XP_023929938.1 caspase-8-like [Lingula anatina]